jgi:hypothetical protein
MASEMAAFDCGSLTGLITLVWWYQPLRWTEEPGMASKMAALQRESLMGLGGLTQWHQRFWYVNRNLIPVRCH